MGKPAILKTCVFQTAQAEDGLDEHFEVHLLPPEDAARAALLDAVGPRIRGIATESKGPVDVALLDRLPALEIVSSWSAGREGIAVDALRERGIAFFHTAAILAEDVADMAMALLLCVVRRIRQADHHVRSGRWRGGRLAYTNRVHGMRLGIVGLGLAGRAVAARAGGFGMEVGYFGPRRKPDVPYRYFGSAAELAAWSDALVLTCAGGEATRHMIDARVLDALGGEGWLINVARGSVVDEAALIAALSAGRIKGAGLDVFENEPDVPAELIASDRVVLTPHHASSTRETKVVQGAAMVDALVRQLCSPSADERARIASGKEGEGH